MSRPTRRTAVAIATLVLALSAPLGLALAGHTFSDVPTSHQFHGDIAAVAASGVTGGCGSNRYCPEAFVTRGQMAAFLNRLGALAPGKPPVVNADEVDGRDANELTRVAAMRTTSTSSGLPARPTYLFYGTPLSITVPTAGFVLVTANVSVINSGGSPCTANCTVGMWIGHTGDENSYGYTETTIDPVGASRASLGSSVLVPVDAGENFLDIRLTRFHGTTGVLQGWYGTLTAVFSPFGSSGATASTAAAQEVTGAEEGKAAP